MADDDLPARHGLRLYFMLGVILLANLLLCIDQGSKETLASTIASDFQSLDLLTWFLQSHMLASVIFSLVCGQVVAIFHYKIPILLGAIIWTGGNIMAGFAASFKSGPFYIASQVLVGAGSAFIGNASQAIMNAYLTKEGKEVMGRAALTFEAAVGKAMGSLIGGGIYKSLGLRVIFWGEAGILAVLTALLAYLIPSIEKRDGWKLKERGQVLWKGLGDLDSLGIILVTAGLTLLIVALNGVNELFPVQDFRFGLMLGLALVCFTLFGVQQRRNERKELKSMLSLKHLVAGAFFLSNVANFSTYSADAIFDTYVPTYLRVIGNDAFRTTLLFMIPCVAGGLLGCLASAGSKWYLDKKKEGSRNLGLRLALLSSIIMLLATILTTALFQENLAALLGPFGFMKIANAASDVYLTFVAYDLTGNDKEGDKAVAVVFAVRALAGSLGVTSAGMIFQLESKNQLTQQGHTDAGPTIQLITQSLDELNHLPAGWTLGEVQQAFIAAFKIMFIVASALAGLQVCALIVLLLRHLCTRQRTSRGRQGGPVVPAGREVPLGGLTTGQGGPPRSDGRSPSADPRI